MSSPSIARLVADVIFNNQKEVIIGVVGGIIFLLIFLAFLSFGSKRGDAFLVLGPSGAGKTSLFLQLSTGGLQQGTVTSMQQNEAAFSLPGTKGPSVRMVDMPGHSRLRSLVEKQLPGARAVLLVLDAVDFMATARSAADTLYDLLSKRSLQRSRLPILIVCNKMDRSSAHTVEFIRKRLEKEIEQLRTTRATMQDIGKGANTDALVGKKGQPFMFSHCPNPIACVGVSVTQNEIGPVFDFIKAYNN